MFVNLYRDRVGQQKFNSIIDTSLKTELETKMHLMCLVLFNPLLIADFKMYFTLFQCRLLPTESS